MGLFDRLFGKKVNRTPTDAGTDCIRLVCPGCDKRLRIKAELAGKRIKCPACHTAQAVPQTHASGPGGERTAGDSYPELRAEYERAKDDPLERVPILGRLGKAVVTSEQKQEVKSLAAQNWLDVKFNTLSRPTIMGRSSLDPWHYFSDMGPGRARFVERQWAYQVEPGHPLFGIPVEALAEHMGLHLGVYRLLDGSGRLAILQGIDNREVLDELNQMEALSRPLFGPSNRDEGRLLFQVFTQLGMKHREPKIDVYRDERDWITRRWQKDYDDCYGRRR